MPKHIKRRRIGIISLCILLAFVLGGFLAFFIYTMGYARAGMRAAELHTDTALRIEDHKSYTSIEAWGGAEDTTGYIFYPGGLVDSAAYLPYLADIARQGYYCAVLEMPFHLAVLGTSRADQVMADNPQITTWVVGGHSLGGVAAASFAEKNVDEVAGLVLLASYPTVDLSATGLRVLSITATNDEVLNPESWNDGRALLPPGTGFASIEGGNHAGFGDYGAQKDDGEATIAAEEQQAQTVALTLGVLADVSDGVELRRVA